eukprot:TRINITY_DN14100_c2_g1_i1.p1 TRINITY_DN14100_c2_g1~~TRINITY_DN14100_c2_g1_i1.p1  ORF type:complete len:119 (+),score=4.04 TRINITY_DN14100_c2_g1_i1:1225-1581(+)
MSKRTSSKKYLSVHSIKYIYGGNFQVSSCKNSLDVHSLAKKSTYDQSKWDTHYHSTECHLSDVFYTDLNGINHQIAIKKNLNLGATDQEVRNLGCYDGHEILDTWVTSRSFNPHLPMN